MFPQTLSTPDPNQHRIRRKPPPILDISERYPSPDPLDPFAPLWVLRNRSSSGLSTQDVLQSDIASRTKSSSHLYSTPTAQVSVNSISPIYSPSPKAKTGHYRPYSAFIDSSQTFPLISSPLASQTDLLCQRQPVVDRRTNVRSQFFDMYDSSGTESDTASASHKAASIQHRRIASSNSRFPKFFLPRKANFLGSDRADSGNRSSMMEFKQARKSNIPPPPVVSTVTWVPNPVNGESMNVRSASKFTSLLSADLLDCGSSDEDDHQRHNRHPMSDVKKDLKRIPSKLPYIPVSSKMFRKRVSSSGPFSSNIRVAPSTRSISSSYVHISTPTPVLSSSQPTSEDAYTSPRKAPVPPQTPISASIQEQAPTGCPNTACGDYCTHSTLSEWDIPTPLQLNYAASLPITGENGKHITFGSLFDTQRTIVIFIRHFWCSLCQAYMSSIKSVVPPEMCCNSCESGGHDPGTPVRFVVISSGAHGMIAKYRQIFGLPFKVYTDPSLAIYQALGLGRDDDVKHQTHRRSTSEGTASDVLSEKNCDASKTAGCVKHNSLMGGITVVMMKVLKVCMPSWKKGDDLDQLGGLVFGPALKVCMPVWEKGGDIGQLGGEFIFGPGLTCTYAHRMQPTEGHAPIQDVLEAARISVRGRTLSSAGDGTQSKPPPITWFTSEKGPRRRRESTKSLMDKGSSQFDDSGSRRYSIGMSPEEEDRWTEYRRNSMYRLQEKKDIRRGIRRAGSEQWQQSSRHHYLESLETMGE